MGPTVAFTIAIGPEARAAARLLRLTFKAHHPEIPFLLIDDALYAAFAGQEEIGHPGEIVGLRLVVGGFLSRLYGRVLYFDSDVLILDRLPALTEGEEKALFTHDVQNVDYGLPVAPINIGVFALSDPDIWRLWMVTNYSHLIPPLGIFFDQFSLRMLCMNKAVPYQMVPEREARDYYNISYYDEPGPWSWDGAVLRKGEARVRLWHWAGYAQKTTVQELPPAVGQAFQATLAHKASSGAAEADRREMERFRRALADLGPLFRFELRQEFASFSTHPLKNLKKDGVAVQTALFCVDAPASFEMLRPALPGLHRRFLPRACRYFYSEDRAVLYGPETDFYDQPWLRVAPALGQFA
ncbi:MAG: hypothetical protein PW734_01520 [Verrucomicrobium sp.]|nr:hypothetical protein [Verrucomicrobium sp.]